MDVPETRSLTGQDPKTILGVNVASCKSAAIKKGREVQRPQQQASPGAAFVAIRWFFFRDKAGQCRWEVQGAGGPIATSGNVFESVADCVADARARGFDGPDEPTV